MADPTPIVSVRNLVKCYGDVRAVDGVSFDVYAGEGIPQGKKSLAIRASYRALDRTLTDEQIQNQHGKLIKALERELGAELR